MFNYFKILYIYLIILNILLFLYCDKIIKLTGRTIYSHKEKARTPESVNFTRHKVSNMPDCNGTSLCITLRAKATYCDKSYYKVYGVKGEKR